MFVNKERMCLYTHFIHFHKYFNAIFLYFLIVRRSVNDYVCTHVYLTTFAQLLIFVTSIIVKKSPGFGFV